MAWQLKIHHIDVGRGDSTLIVAREVGVAEPKVRSVLVDGGLLDATQDVHNITQCNKLDVMVATHYDEDHLNGLRGLLLLGDDHYLNTRIYDQGIPNTVRITKKRTAEGDVKYLKSIAAGDSGYKLYEDSIYNRLRVTENVVSSLDLIATGNQEDMEMVGLQQPDWLVGKDILWDGVDGVIPDGAPRMTCIAANQYVLQSDGTTARLQSGVLTDSANEKSLAFVVQFNNFRYYLGGDIESAQEDGKDNTPGIMQYLNPQGNAEGRVLAFKVSHHGSAKSTSQQFVNRLKPAVAFISTGCDKKYGDEYLPSQRVIDTLQNSDVRLCFLTEDRNTESWRDYAQYNSNKVVVGGKWSGPDNTRHEPAGDIVLTVSEEESKRPLTAATHFRVIFYYSSQHPWVVDEGNKHVEL
ncbi:hypothetical protein SPSIL_041240 [Sporomusa silvacetica DSM 10669]|uniref:Uncharacterized protein n=1 Tax=Sporomusa silvacetica DSM 10669 TaxID=1123289 RepID=A0ABZ3IQR3_9FIRM|nr:hypothetical protein [Sporomusa silvacetica]OZC20386.1 hypothetical protein SPSIL_12530 [Sporomusa silvacetica DSM 10669]